eukprot:GHVR01067854.1.p1 GENE.GHVR01067854.1~~GHVR01067854.1.p1  ORF type:complete len:206 (+),score=33.49 GHVR01067854.1:28-645(+)
MIQEIKLDPNEVKAEQHFANMYAIIKTVEALENAFVNGRCNPSEYEQECVTLLTHFRMVQSAVKHKYPDLNEYFNEHKMQCELARNRLLVEGIPATRLYPSHTAQDDQKALLTFQISTAFINLLDTLKLNETAVDSVQPPLLDLVSKLTQLSSLPSELKGVSRIKDWVTKMNVMAACDNLSENDVRQLTHDVDTAYSSFEHWLKT